MAERIGANRLGRELRAKRRRSNRRYWIAIGSPFLVLTLLLVACTGGGAGSAPAGGATTGPAAQAPPSPPARAEASAGAAARSSPTAPRAAASPSPAHSIASPSPSPAPAQMAGSPSPSAGQAVLPSADAIPRAQPGQEEVILATTTSTQDSGLLDVLLPDFERRTGYRVKPIAVGTGQALALGARGEADVVLVHAPAAERRWLEEGNGTDRLLVMHNDFIVIGPPEDPAAVKGLAAEAAFRRIAEVGAPFISRGDNSGTHQQELAIWQAAGLDPQGQTWYQETGQGMGATLNVANEKQAYTLTDRGTYLARRGTLGLDVLVERSPALLNVYHVLPVNPAKFPRVNAEGARALAAFFVSREAQAQIAVFGLDRFGQPLFFPDAGKPEPAGG